MNLFDPITPGARVWRSSFGGGWIAPLDAAGGQALREFFGEAAPVVAPLEAGGACAYIVEPYQAADLAEHLRSCNVTWEIG